MMPTAKNNNNSTQTPNLKSSTKRRLKPNYKISEQESPNKAYALQYGGPTNYSVNVYTDFTLKRKASKELKN